MDGWFIAPKIIGDNVGIGPLLIILGIVLGGGLLGILGMLLGIPTIALIKSLLEKFIDEKSKNKQLQ
mgnify:CR=1 FL=1